MGYFLYKYFSKRSVLFVFQLLLLSSFGSIVFLILIPKISKLRSFSSSSLILIDALRTRPGWDLSEAPSFCQEILRFPQPFRTSCNASPYYHDRQKCDEKRQMMFSQYGEDYYLYTRHFAMKKEPGVYLDIATNDPIQISNTYFFDRCLGWRGICVEANQDYFQKIFLERSCLLIPTCLSKAEGEKVTFVFSGPGSGILGTHRRGKSVLDFSHVQSKNLSCLSLMPQMKRFMVTKIDYLNLDVEGHELHILQSIDWENVFIGIISIEIVQRDEEEIMRFLKDRDFREINTSIPINNLPGMNLFVTNKIFIHNSINFGKP